MTFYRVAAEARGATEVAVALAWALAGVGPSWEAAGAFSAMGGRIESQWSLVGSAHQCARRSSFGGSKESVP